MAVDSAALYAITIPDYDPPQSHPPMTWQNWKYKIKFKYHDILQRHSQNIQICLKIFSSNFSKLENKFIYKKYFFC